MKHSTKREKSLINMDKINSILFSFLFILFTYSSAFCQGEMPKPGTLIVSYQTGQKGERLSRIRFWLKSENREPQMYPKGSNYVDVSPFLARTVVIENLNPGKYTLQFLIPNKDGFFDEVLPRELLIVEDETLKIDQKIRPKRTKA